MAIRKVVDVFCINAVLSLSLMISGCGGERFVYAPVSGMVTLDGKPLETAKVVFFPQQDEINDGLTGQISYGVTNATGQFKLESTGGENGARVGKHLVAILGEIRDDANPDRIIKSEYLKKEYYEGKTLEFEIPPGGTDAARFDLTSDGKGR